MNVSAKAKVVKTVYNVLLDRVESVTLGSVRANIADTIVNQNNEIASKPNQTTIDQAMKSTLEQAREVATEWLTNGKGYAYFRKDDNGNIIDILFLDTPDIETAVNVLRIGQSGIGFSYNGVNGPYESAWTIDGKFNADFITVGTLDASLVEVVNLVAQNVSSSSDDSQINITGAVLKMLYGVLETVKLSNESNGLPILYFKDYEDGKNTNNTEITGHGIKIGGTSESPVFEFVVSDGKPYIRLGGEDFPMEVYWEPNGDGTYTLIGK
jgi:hypothetical protein